MNQDNINFDYFKQQEPPVEKEEDTAERNYQANAWVDEYLEKKMEEK